MDVTHWRIKQAMASVGTEWTRENYIAWAWAGLEIPEEWDESELPEDLQDWNAPPPK